MSDLFHGSDNGGITVLEPFSTLYGTDKKVVYLTGSIPYALVYIWDGNHNNLRKEKHVTAWVKNGTAYYEEQFPDQLETFYKSVSGYLYRACDASGIKACAERESIFYSTDRITVEKALMVPDVYEELLRYEESGKFRVRRFNEQSIQRQMELTELIANAILRDNFCYGNEEKAKFYKMYFENSWELAKKLKGKGYDK